MKEPAAGRASQAPRRLQHLTRSWRERGSVTPSLCERGAEYF